MGVLSSVNQILLLHCFLMMVIADLVRTETEADYDFNEGDDDESFLMERADAVSNLLPCLGTPIMVTQATNCMQLKMYLTSLASLIFGNGLLGTGTSRNLHNGSHPSRTLKMRSLSSGTSNLTSS